MRLSTILAATGQEEALDHLLSIGAPSDPLQCRGVVVSSRKTGGVIFSPELAPGLVAFDRSERGFDRRGDPARLRPGDAVLFEAFWRGRRLFAGNVRAIGRDWRRSS